MLERSELLPAHLKDVKSVLPGVKPGGIRFYVKAGETLGKRIGTYPKDVPVPPFVHLTWMRGNKDGELFLYFLCATNRGVSLFNVKKCIEGKFNLKRQGTLRLQSIHMMWNGDERRDESVE